MLQLKKYPGSKWVFKGLYFLILPLNWIWMSEPGPDNYRDG